MTVAKKAVPKELLDSLLADPPQPAAASEGAGLRWPAWRSRAEEATDSRHLTPSGLERPRLQARVGAVMMVVIVAAGVFVAMAATIILVSLGAGFGLAAASPWTLARDAGLLVHQAGYRCSAAGIVNMFPHTAHVESIAVFDRDAPHQLPES